MPEMIIFEVGKQAEGVPVIHLALGQQKRE